MRIRLLPLLAAAFLIGCDSGPTDVTPETGRLQVTIQTSGDDLDPDGYKVRVTPGSISRAVDVNGSVTLEDLSPGTYRVGLDDLEFNCVPGEPGGWEAEVVADSAANVVAEVTCDRKRWEVVKLASRGRMGVDFVTPSVGRAAIRGENPLFLWTTDGGETWDSRVVTAEGDQAALFAFPTGSFGIMGGQTCTLLVTTDGGEAWTQRQVCSIHTGRWLLSSHFFDDQTGWVGGGGGLLFRTEDGGQTWESHGAGALGYYWPITGIDFAGDGQTGVLVGSSGDGAVFRTTDGGESWERQEAIVDLHLNEVAFADNSTVVAVGQSGVVIRSTDAGVTWTRIQTGHGTNLWGLAFGDDGFGLATGSDGMILVTRDGGESWAREMVDVGGELADVSILSATDVWVAGTQGTIIHRVRD